MVRDGKKRIFWRRVVWLRAGRPNPQQTTTTTSTTTTTTTSVAILAQGHSWPGLSQWLPRHPPLVWFEATRAAQHVWPDAFVAQHVRTCCAEVAGSGTMTISRWTHLAATLLRRLASLLPRQLRSSLRVGSDVLNASWSRSGVCSCHRS